MDALTFDGSLPLENWYHERFCQLLARALCAGEPVRESRIAAYKEAFAAKPGFDPDGSSLPDNARRLANLQDVKARVQRLNYRAAVLADTDRGWCVAQLRKRVEDFNLDDFLSGEPGTRGRRFDVDNATREQLGQLAELTIEEDIVPGVLDELEIKRRKIRLKPYDPVATVRLIADLSGAMPAARHEHSGPGGGAIGLEALVLASMAPAPQLPAPPKAIEHVGQ